MKPELPPVPPAMPCDLSGPALSKVTFTVDNPHRGAGRQFTLWRARPAPKARPFYILTEGEEELERGDKNLYLAPLESLDLLRGDGAPGHYEIEAFHEICKEQGLAREVGEGKDRRSKEVEELVDELDALHKLTSIFYRLEPPYPRETLIQLGEELPDVLELALRGGWRVDEDLVFLFKPHLTAVEPSTIPPEVAMRSAANEIVITGTKPGKTSISRRLGLNREHPTSAGILGFATADKRVYGPVHGSRSTIFVDEVAQDPNEEVASSLLTYLEMGEVNIARGMNIRIRGHGPVVFMSNPSQEEVYDPLQSFVGVLRALSLRNLLGLGSRIPMAYFNPQTKPARNELHLNREEMGQLQALITSFQAHTAPLLSAALLDAKVERWLEEGFPEEHLQSLNRAIGEVRLPEIRDFLTGYRDSHRHARGLALRVAFVDTAHLHLEAGGVQIQALLLRAEELWPTVLSMREASLQRLVRVAGDVEMVRRVLAARFRGFRHEYLRRGLAAIAAWWRDRQEVKDEILKGTPFPFEDTREPYLASPAHDRTQTRSLFSYVANTLERNVNAVSSNYHQFGIRMALGAMGLEFAVTSQETFRIAMEVVAIEVARVPVVERVEDKQTPPQGTGEGSEGSEGNGGTGTPPDPEEEVEAGEGMTRSVMGAGEGKISGSEKGLANGSASTASIASTNSVRGGKSATDPLYNGSGVSAPDSTLDEDIFRFIKLKDRGYGVPLTAAAHELSRDYGVQLTKQDLQPSIQRLLKEGKIVEPRPSVFRLSKGGS